MRNLLSKNPVLWLNADVRFILNQGSTPQAAGLLRAGKLISTPQASRKTFPKIYNLCGWANFLALPIDVI
jgi:hypothetical protein